ncbi:nuclear transport factor 2 family protein [Lysobacter soli]|uniref:nuclear transport factor 2 family protein n=1 Tax=Lysobacter soli TaxID=453783 RepID=UPI0024107DC2|nr:nuclear transport factor 2 family protein [Lysobacter soli]MDG2518370.1 nuclear transport factor 2 family protein [Lysobacter soli]
MPSKGGNTTNPKRRAFLALVAAVSITPAATFDSPASTGIAAMPAELAAPVVEYRRATIRSDIATLSALVADDYILVNSDASLQAKASYLADFRLPGFRIERYAMEQPAHAVWGDTALVRGLLHLKWTQDGSKHTRVLRIAHVWHKRDGRWRLAYTQLTRSPGP